MFLEFKNDKNTTEIAEKFCNIYYLGVIIDCQALNWFPVTFS